MLVGNALQFSNATKWLFTLFTFIILLSIITFFAFMVHSIDQKNITKSNSQFSIISSYYIDKQNTSSVNNILLKANFINSPLDKIPYAFAEQSYWIKLTLQYPIHNALLSSTRNDIINSNSPSLGREGLDDQIILLAEHSMLQTFEVYSININSGAELIHAKPSISKTGVQKYVPKNIYPYTPLLLNKFGQSEFLIHVKAAGAPNIPLLLFTPDNFEQRMLLSQLIYGAFIGLLIFIALYSLILFFFSKNTIYLLFISYILSTLTVFSSLSGFGHFLFSSNIMHIINHYLVLLNHLHVIVLLLFTVYFLRYNILTSWVLKFSVLLSLAGGAIALVSLFLNESSQVNLFLVVKAVFYLISLLLIINRFKKDHVWAYAYFISWLPLLIATLIDILVVLKTLDYSFITYNALLFATMIQIILIAFALENRFRHNLKNQLNTITYHENTMIPRRANLDFCLSKLLTKHIDNFTVVVIKPEQFEQIYSHTDDETRRQFYKNLYLKLSSLFSLNNSVLTITSNKEKLCLIEDIASVHSFALVIENKLNQEDISVLAQNIQTAVTQAYTLKELSLPLSAFIGLANYPEHGNASNSLIKNAIQAVKQAELEQCKWAIYDANISQHDTSSIQLVIDLHQAIENKNFEIYHQPQVDLKTNKVCSSECLIRWQHPVIGFVAPDVFIPMAENFGLMPSLSLWIIETALKQQVILSEQTGFNHMISINISIKDLIQTNFADSVADIISEIKIKAEKVIFELTTCVALPENEQVLKTIAALTTLGITVSINDFDASFSATPKNSRLFFQELKVNRSLVENIANDRKRKIMTTVSVKVAKALKLEVVAEGINSILDEEIVKKIGCDIGQGHYYAKAMSHADYIDWLMALSNGQIPDSIDGEFIPATKH